MKPEKQFQKSKKGSKPTMLKGSLKVLSDGKEMSLQEFLSKRNNPTLIINGKKYPPLTK